MLFPDLSNERNTELGMNIEFIWGNSFKTNFETKNSVLISNPPWGYKHDIENIPNFLKNIEIILKKFDTSLIIVSEDFINSFEKMNVNIKILHKTRIRGMVSYILKITKII